MQNGVKILTENGLVEIYVSGILTPDFYDTFVPAIESIIQAEGKIRVLFVMDDFHGWSPGAFWDDIKFDFKHFNDFLCIACVGDRRWEKALTTFCQPFTTAKVKYFDVADLAVAKAWALHA